MWRVTSTPLFLFYRCNSSVRLSPFYVPTSSDECEFLWNDAGREEIKFWDRKLPCATLTIKLLMSCPEPLDYEYEIGLGAIWNETYIIAVCSLQMRGADSCSAVAAESVQVNIKHACLCIVCVIVCSCSIVALFLVTCLFWSMICLLLPLCVLNKNVTEKFYLLLPLQT